MPDLTIEYYYHCLSAEHFETMVQGSGENKYCVIYGKMTSGNPFEHDWGCNCKGFQFNGKCKHIAIAKERQCGWYQFIDGGEPVNGKCPECQGDIKSMGYGV